MIEFRGRKYIFKSSMPPSVRAAYERTQAEKRSTAAKKAAETRRANKAKAPSVPQPKLSKAERRIRDKIERLNARIEKYGDPNNAIKLMPAEIHADGRFLVTPETIHFFMQYEWMLKQFRSQIRLHPVKDKIRKAFEEMALEIYDEIKQIGQEQFDQIMSEDFKKKLSADQDSDEKMMRVMQMWQQEKSKIPEYYEGLARGGRLTPFTDRK